MPGVPVDPRRVVVDRVRPLVDCGALPAKATSGLPLPISAVLVADGHDPLLGWVWHGPPVAQLRDTATPPRGWREVPLEAQGNDRYAAWITPDQVGGWAFAVGAVPDEYGAWLRDLRIRIEAGQDTSLDLEEGAIMAERRHREGLAAADRRALTTLAGQLRARAAPGARLHHAERPHAIALMRRTADRSRATLSGPFPLWVDRERAGFSAWYEMFPRSEGAKPPRSGTFVTAAQRRVETRA